jgi:hypothetical protein
MGDGIGTDGTGTDGTGTDGTGNDGTGNDGTGTDGIGPTPGVTNTDDVMSVPPAGHAGRSRPGPARGRCRAR